MAAITDPHLWLAAAASAAVVAAGAIAIFKLEIARDLATCWWEEADLREVRGEVCRYVGRDTGTVKEVALLEIRCALRDESAEAPEVLRLQLGHFTPEKGIFVREIARVGQ